jgi:hypothetical protein
MNNFRKDLPPTWRFILYGLVYVAVFCYAPISRGDHKPADIMFFASGGVFCGLFLWFIITSAKKPNPWVKRNIGLIAKIGGFIVASLTIWSILTKK